MGTEGAPDFDPLHGIVAPPDVARFRELTGVGDAPLEVDFGGWSKLAVLSPERVFLFPRRGREADLLHGADVCQAIGELVASAPAVLGRWDEEEIPSAGPFVAFERRPGRSWISIEDQAPLDDWLTMLASLGAAIATWHSIPPASLPRHLRSRPAHSPNPVLRNALGDQTSDLLDDAARLTGAPGAWVGVWRTALEAVSRLEPVLLHGDVCENQLLVGDDLSVGTVLDWDTAGVGHRLHDFDFGEWGFGIYRFEDEFPRLRRTLWESYCAALGGDVPMPRWTCVHLVFVLAELALFERRSRAGDLDGWGLRRLARLRQAIGPATEAAGSR